MKSKAAKAILVVAVDKVGVFGKCSCGNIATKFCDATIINDHVIDACSVPICDSCTHDFTPAGILSDRKVHVRKDSSRFIPIALRAACDFCEELHTIKCAAIDSNICHVAQKKAASWKVTISAKKLANKFNSVRR